MCSEIAAHVSRRRLSLALSLSGIVAIVVAAAATPAVPSQAASGIMAAPARASSDPHVAARARAVATGKPVAIPELTTEDSTTVANADGTFTLRTTVLPTRMKDASGAWENIDPTLRRNPDGSISTLATPNALTLSGGGGGPVVTLADRSGHVLALSLPVALPRPVLSGDSATYRGLYRGLDLVV